LFALLEETHRLEAIESVTRLMRPSAADAELGARVERLGAIARDLLVIYQHVVLTEDLTTDLPALSEDLAHFGAQAEDETLTAPIARRSRPNKLESVRNFVEGIAAEDVQPTFYYLHTLLTHFPWFWLPSGQRNATLTRFATGVRWWQTTDEWGLRHAYQRHLLHLRLMDSLIGRMIGRLEAAGLYERALVVVTSDHGISFRPGESHRRFSLDTAAEIMRVPLIVKVPATMPAPPAVTGPGGQHVDDRNVETIDIAPTIADAAGLELPWTADGASLLDPVRTNRSTKRVFILRSRRVHEYPDRGPNLMPALAHKLKIFGGSSNTYHVPLPPRHGELVGRDVDDFHVERGGGRVEIASLEAFRHVDPLAPAVPFDVSGRLSKPPAQSFAHVAVAVNGTIAAVTRTWNDARGRWLATVPPERWRRGTNDLAVFLVEEEEGVIVLRRCTVAQRRSRRGPT
jgi:hypothetical protein